MTLDDLNTIPPARATELFTACCGSSSWVSQLVARRPFQSLDAVLSAADEVWSSLAKEDWLEAFAHHPRIGETTSRVAQTDRAREWSAAEQSGATRAAESVAQAQRDLNAQYERRFGYIYIVSATGKAPTEMLALVRDRLSNDPVTELKVAAEEQRKITRLRLKKLLG